MQRDDDDEEECAAHEEFDDDVYALLDSDILKEYYILSHWKTRDPCLLQRENMQVLSAYAVYLRKDRGLADAGHDRALTIARICPFRLELVPPPPPPLSPLEEEEGSAHVLLPHATLKATVERALATRGNRQHVLCDILLYNFAVDASHLSALWCRNRTAAAAAAPHPHQCHLRSLLPHFLEGADVQVEPSIFLFHRINRVYFLFQES